MTVWQVYNIVVKIMTQGMDEENERVIYVITDKGW